MNSVVFLINTKNVYIFFIFGCWLLPEKIAFARKMMALPESGAAAYTPRPQKYALPLPKIPPK